MKKIKLFSLVAAALFAGSAMAAEAPTPVYREITASEVIKLGSLDSLTKIQPTGWVASGFTNGTSSKSATIEPSVDGDIVLEKATNKTGLKLKDTQTTKQITLYVKGITEVHAYMCGSDKRWVSMKVTTQGKTEEVKDSLDNKNTKVLSQVNLNPDTEYTLNFSATNDACFYAIKFIAGAACEAAELSLPENPDIEVNEGAALVAPELTNPNNVAVTYASSDESVVKVAADGKLTGVGAGDAVITISAARQTVGDKLYCADELTYNVKIKSLSPVLEATESALDFSLNAFETTKSATFTVSGYNLSGVASVSTLPDGFTLDPATLTITAGAVDQAFTLTYTAEAAVEASNANLVFTVGTTSVTIALTYGKKAALSQTIVTDSTTWNWSKAGIEEVQLDSTKTIPTRLDTFVLANVEGIVNDANFNSQALLVRGQYMVRESKYFQGDYISFNVEKAGTVKVEFSNTGNRTNAATDTRYLYVNGAKTAAGSLRSDANVTSEEIAVPAGKVEITFMLPDESKGNQYGRVYSITYRVKKDIGSAVEQVNGEVKAVKVMRDGQLLIIRDGKTYTAQGVELR